MTPSDVKTPAEQSSTVSLVQGIVNDIGTLIKHEVRFARAEIAQDLAKTKTAAAFLAVGAAAGFVGFVLFALMLVHLLHQMGIPADHPLAHKGLQLWAAYGIVSLVFLLIASALIWLGIDRFSRFNPMPEKTLENIQENASWIANQTANSK